MPQNQPTLDQIREEITEGVQQITGPRFETIENDLKTINKKLDNFDINFQGINTQFMAVNEKFKQVDENISAVKREISHLPSKREFFDTMDKIMTELKTIRQEQAVTGHRVTVIEQKVLI